MTANGPDRGRRQFLRASALAGTALLLPGCARKSEQPAARAVRYVLNADLLTANFALALDQPTRQIGTLVTEGLVGLDSRLEPVPRAAESWEWSADHLTLTFHLRDGLTWHDGRPVTSDDVLFTWRTVTDAKDRAPDRASGFRDVAGMEAKGPRDVVVRYRRPFAPALAAWTATNLLLVPRHAPPAEGQAPLGCGRYRIAGHERGQRLVLERVPTAIDAERNAPRLEFDVLRDYSTRFAALRAGRIDLTPVLPLQAREIESTPDLDRRFALLRYRVLFYQYIAWRMDGSNPFFADARVRRAMTLAIDRASYLEHVMAGAGDIAATSFHPDQWAYDPSLAPLPHDVAAARALLAEAGWKPGADGVLVKDGRPFRFTLTFSTATPETGRLAQLVAANLREAGVEAQLAGLEWAVYNERARSSAFDALLGFWYLDPADPDPFDLWHSDAAKGGANYAGLRDPEIDRLLESARTTFDRAERAALYRSVGARLHALQPNTFLLFPRTTVAFDRRLRGVAGCAAGVLSFVPGPAAWSWSTGG